MNKTGGHYFNATTNEWEYTRVKYTDFHCTSEEWGKLHNSRYLLVRDWLDSIDLTEMMWNDATVKDVISQAVKDIICGRYEIDIKEVTVRIIYDITPAWKITVPGAPYCVYIKGIYRGKYRIIPEPYEPIHIKDEYDRKRMIRTITGVCDAIFRLINSVKTKDKYYDKYKSGQYKLHTYCPTLDAIKLF